MVKILILGGTTEARQLAQVLAGRADLDITLSLAGRTTNPVAQPVPVRTGGFGGAEGLAGYLRAERVDLLVDATHPYAAQISANAASAASSAGVAILALRRPDWEPVKGDDWQMVDSAEAAAGLLGDERRRVFLALGRQEVGPFEARPQHGYVIRSVDLIEPPLAVPDATYLLARGPFLEADEIELLAGHRIETIVCKNSGGQATYGKIAAARRLGIPVLMIRRPDLPDVPSADSVAGLFALIDHAAAPAAKRGV